MYEIALFIHSWLRWIILVAAVFLIVRSILGLKNKSPWQKLDETLHKAYLHSFNLQFILGLILYFALSPISTAALENMAGSMKDPQARFWAVEHIFIMTLAIMVSHIGLSKAARKGESNSRYKTTLIALGISLVLICAGIPWPGMAAARELFRFTLS